MILIPCQEIYGFSLPWQSLQRGASHGALMMHYFLKDLNLYWQVCLELVFPKPTHQSQGIITIHTFPSFAKPRSERPIPLITLSVVPANFSCGAAVVRARSGEMVFGCVWQTWGQPLVFSF